MHSNQFLIFENSGEIDHRLITTIGTNVKETENPIGRFGSGLKYGLAITLRLGGDLTIQSGYETYSFHTKEETVRGKEFQFIHMDVWVEGKKVESQQLGFTTSLGAHWEPWMAYREFYCNGLDEPDFSVCLDIDVPDNEENTTRFIISNCPQLITAHHERKAWLVPQVKPLWTSPRIMILPNNGSKNYYYHGIKVGEFSTAPQFTYNILKSVALTEDRTVPVYSVKNVVEDEILIHCNNTNLIADLITAQDGKPEHDWDFGYVWTKPNPTLIETVQRLKQNKMGLINHRLMRQLDRWMPEEKPIEIPLSGVQYQTLERAKVFLAGMGFAVTNPIVVMDSLGSQWLNAMTRDEVIYLPVGIFGKGTKFVASILLEQHLLLHLNLSDDKSLHDFLFDKIISLGEELNGEPL